VADDLERAIARQRNALLRIERNGASAIVQTYQAVERRLKYNLDLLTYELERAKAARIEVKPGWLFAQSQYQTLITELGEATLAFIHRAIATVTANQREAVGRAPTDAERLILSALGPAPRYARDMMLQRFTKLPAPQLEHLIGRAGDGQPLGNLLAEIVPASVTAAKNALAYGVATGQNPRIIAQDVQVRTGMARTRALAVARTETLGAYRHVAQERFKDSRVVQQWEWRAKLDARTCPSCMAMNGTLHPISEPLASHPNCRCVSTPRTASWAELGFTGIPDNRPPSESPEDRFAQLPEAEQLAILGATRLNAYNEGLISMGDLVHDTHSQRWGRGRRMATLQEMGLRV
jgi:SPP1 gp7 family putative phage head morphogenesis protein